MRRSALWAIVLLFAAPAARAQDYDGYFSTLFVVMPDVGTASGRQLVAELRTRLFVEGLFTAAEAWEIRAGVFVDALLGDRSRLGGDSTAAAAVVRPADLYAEFRGATFDVRAGMSRIVWGRLDEFQPTDVVNPIDLSRFVLEGRSEARLPVALLRGRVFLPGSTTLEGIVVPVFRAGRFDQLQEDTSPFMLAPVGIRERREPATAWGNTQGGARLTATIGRVDVGVSAWRGFEHFPTYMPVVSEVEGPALSEVEGPAPFVSEELGLVLLRYVEVFPRFTMVGADFETVRGPWGLRGEFAWFDSAAPRTFEGGIGADRRAGNYRVALNAVLSRADDTEVTLVGWAERSFARETRTARLLAVYDPSDETAFVRGIAAWNVRDNVSLEASAGWFAAGASGTPRSGSDVLALLSRRDFAYARVKVHF